jgi:hypothetical protein
VHFCTRWAVLTLQKFIFSFSTNLSPRSFTTARHLDRHVVHGTHQLLWHFVPYLGQAGFEFGCATDLAKAYSHVKHFNWLTSCDNAGQSFGDA